MQDNAKREVQKSIVNEDDVTHLINHFPIFKAIHDKYGTPPNWNRPEGFETLVLLILEQQVSLSAAKAHFDKLSSYVPELSPDALLKLSEDEFRKNAISRQKTKYLIALSTAVKDGSLKLEKLRTLPEVEIKNQLMQIKGIGNWTAEVYLMSALQHKDIFPIGDIALFNTIKELAGLQDKQAMLDLSEQWRPYRSLSTYFFWHYYLEKRKK